MGAQGGGRLYAGEHQRLVVLGDKYAPPVKRQWGIGGASGPRSVPGRVCSGRVEEEAQDCGQEGGHLIGAAEVPGLMEGGAVHVTGK